MQVFIVGGAVRDDLLGRPVQDRDWVVVGATPKEMLARGFRPVGKDFPVFLHPGTHEEYALARTERKSGNGYKGFTVHSARDVTLEEDLLRRDLTINAMARTPEGSLIDPYHGYEDLKKRLFRHVSPAFAEDPVRILRLARFAARFSDFSIAPETMSLMRMMVANGEVDHLVAERVWQELARGLMEAKPSRMIEVLRDCGALQRLLPEVDRLFGIPQPEQHHPEIDAGIHTLAVIDCAAAANLPLAARWACLLHDVGKGETPAEILPHHYEHEARSAALAGKVSIRLKAPAECRDLAVLFAREHGLLHHVAELRPTTIVKLLQRTDALRRPQRFALLVEAARCDSEGRPGREPAAYRAAELWHQALQAVLSVDAGEIARACTDKKNIPARLQEARANAVRVRLSGDSPSGAMPQSQS